MFLGEYSHTLDAKGRLIIPARLRQGLEEGLVVTRGYDPCLLVYPLHEWQALAEKVALTPLSSRMARSYRRLTFGGAQEATLDKMGRVLLPAFLREYASIGDEAVIVGVSSYIEIWSPSKWQQMVAIDLQNSDAMQAEMARLGV